MAGQAEYPDGIQFDDVSFMRGLDRQIKRLKNVTKGDIRATGVEVINKAKTFAAVDTGLMRNSIVSQEQSDDKSIRVDVYCRVDYWRYVEFGTSHQAAQPFMRPAFALGKQYLINRVTGRGGRIENNSSSREMVSYTSRAGRTSQITRRQYENYTRRSRA